MNKANLVIGASLVLLLIGLLLLVGSGEDKLSDDSYVETVPTVDKAISSGTGELVQEIVNDKAKDALGNLNQNQDTSIVSSSDLLGQSWIWKETLMNDGKVISPKQPGIFALTFDAEGRVNGQTDCNGFGGDYSVNDGVLKMGPFMMTMMYCEESQEMEFQKMLSEPVTFMFTEAGELVLMLPFDSGSVIFKPKK